MKITLLLLFSAPLLFAQIPKSARERLPERPCAMEVVSNEKPLEAREAAGTVYGGSSEPEFVLKYATLDFIAAFRASKVISVTADSHGKFRAPLGRGLYFFRVSSPGFNCLEGTLKIDRTSKVREIKLELPLGA